MREPRWRRYLRFWRSDSAGDVDDELRFHFDRRVEEFEGAGATHEEALAEARRRFGDVASVRTELVHIDQRIGQHRDRHAWLESFMQDLRYALRSLRRQPFFVAAVVITLALAVGANLTVFSLVDALFFRPPSGVVDGGSLGRLYVAHPNLAGSVVGKPIYPRFSYEDFRSMREATRGLARVAIDFAYDSMDVDVGTSTSFAGVSYATADLLPMLGVRIERGRTFTDAEDDVNTPAEVAVISRSFATRVFGGAVDPLGTELRIQDRIYRVIGVSAPEFSGLDLGTTSIWVPFSTRALPDPTNSTPWYKRGDVFIPLVVRLQRDADPRAVEARATIGYQRLHNMTARAYANSHILVGPIQEARGPGNQSREEMIAPRIAVVAILLFIIACANVANLLLARSWTRRREFAVRAALGISRGRLATLVLVEALVLTTLAGIASLLVGHWGGGLLRTQLLPTVHWPEAVLAQRAVVFVAAITCVAALLAGAAPALSVARGTSSDALRSGSPQASVRRSRLRSVLIVVQASLAVVLVVGAALFGKSLRNVRNVDLGYDADRLVVASLYFPDRLSHPEAGARLIEIAERASRMPGVAGATATYGGPFTMWISLPLYRAGADSAHPIDKTPNFIGVGEDYFRITGTKIIEGRAFLPSDRRGAEPVIVVGKGMAAQLWPNQSAIGQCLHPRVPSNPCYRVVGVAEDVHEFRIVNEEPETQYYFPLDQLPGKLGSAEALMVRAGAGTSNEVAAAIRAMLREEFPSVQVQSRTAMRAIEPEMRPWVLGARIFAALSMLALLVAMIGVYAMAAFEARQRTREIGVRIALGAQSKDVVSLLVRQGSRVVAIGVVCGGAVAIAGGRFVESVLFGVSSHDPMSILGASAVLLAVAATASFIPSWRATRVDPVVVLRDE